MIVKMIGALLILTGCTAVGFRIAAAHHKEEHSLEALCFLLDYMQCELQYRMTPLPELCRKTASQSSGVMKEVFYLLAVELESQLFPDVTGCMDSALSKCKTLPVHSERCLRQLGKTMGRFDVEGQIVGLESSRQYCRRILKQLRNNKDNRLRSYKTLGLCAGAALVIIFL